MRSCTMSSMDIQYKLGRVTVFLRVNRINPKLDKALRPDSMQSRGLPLPRRSRLYAGA